MRWIWPALTGTFATLSAALAIALFAVPRDNGNPAVASTPAVETPLLVVETQPPKSHHRAADRLDDPADDPSVENPLERTFSPLVEGIFRFEPAPSSALAMRKRLLRTIELDEFVRPVAYRTSTRPQATPLKVNSHRNQQLWEEQL